jgi:hypothetical protein
MMGFAAQAVGDGLSKTALVWYPMVNLSGRYGHNVGHRLKSRVDRVALVKRTEPAHPQRCHYDRCNPAEHHCRNGAGAARSSPSPSGPVIRMSRA